MNDIYKCSSRTFFVVLLQICISLTAFSCDSDSTEEQECTETGETESCDDGSNNSGYKVCLPEGVYSTCLRKIPKAGQPCSDLGQIYACDCDGSPSGTLYCLKGNVYSECFCDSAPASALGSAGSGGQETASDGSDACPAPFVCEGIQQGGAVNNLCVVGGMPPFCETNTDCDDEGLEGAQCIDPGLGTKVCLKACN